MAAGVAALYGPLHGGANEAALRMLRRIENKDNIPDFIKGVKDGKERLMGFGHRVYKNYDPRAKIIKKAADEVLEVTGTNPLLDIALELEKIALEDEYFIDRKLYPNVDFYSGLIYEALGMPMEMFPVLFAIGRTSGWIAQWLEMIDDKEQKIARPRQIYTGSRGRDYVPMDQRRPEPVADLDAHDPGRVPRRTAALRGRWSARWPRSSPGRPNWPRRRPNTPADTRLRRYSPEQQVVARFELAGPERRLAQVHAGVDVHGDGIDQGLHRPGAPRERIEPAQGEDGVAGLRRALGNR